MILFISSNELGSYSEEYYPFRHMTAADNGPLQHEPRLANSKIARPPKKYSRRRNTAVPRYRYPASTVQHSTGTAVPVHLQYSCTGRYPASHWQACKLIIRRSSCTHHQPGGHHQANHLLLQVTTHLTGRSSGPPLSMNAAGFLCFACYLGGAYGQLQQNTPAVQYLQETAEYQQQQGPATDASCFAASGQLSTGSWAADSCVALASAFLGEIATPTNSFDLAREACAGNTACRVYIGGTYDNGTACGATSADVWNDDQARAIIITYDSTWSDPACRAHAICSAHLTACGLSVPVENEKAYLGISGYLILAIICGIVVVTAVAGVLHNVLFSSKGAAQSDEAKSSREVEFEIEFDNAMHDGSESEEHQTDDDIERGFEKEDNSKRLPRVDTGRKNAGRVQKVIRQLSQDNGAARQNVKQAPQNASKQAGKSERRGTTLDNPSEPRIKSRPTSSAILNPKKHRQQGATSVGWIETRPAAKKVNAEGKKQLTANAEFVWKGKGKK